MCKDFHNDIILTWKKSENINKSEINKQLQSIPGHEVNMQNQ